MRSRVLAFVVIAVGATAVLTCGQTESVIVDLSGHADTLVLAGTVEMPVVTHADTTLGVPDTVFITHVDTIAAPPDSILITKVDTVVVGTDTTFVARVDTLVTVDTIIATLTDTLVSVDTVIVADTVYIQSRLVASLNALTLDSGQSATLKVTAQDPVGVATVPQQVTWLSDAPGIASVNMSGVVLGRSPGTANVFAIASGLSAAIPTTVNHVESPSQPPPPPPPGSQSRFFLAHQPAGMTRLREVPFSALDEGWATPFDGDPESIVQDPTAPHSPPDVIQFKFSQGESGGNSMGNRAVLPWSARKTIYIYMTWKIDPNWQGHASGINKVFFLRADNPDRGAGWKTFFVARGTDSGSLQLWVLGQEQCCGSFGGSWPANVGSGTLERGRWYELEFLFISNTPGQRNGVLRVWKDGQLTHDYSDWHPLESDEGPGHEGLDMNPIWGGIGDTIEHDQYEWVDHIYVSGK